MVKPHELLNNLHQQFGQLLPDVAKQAQEDVQENLKVAVSSVLGKLDLVTREEFDIQQEVLKKTREKVEALEKRVAELEKLAD
ncbi:MAG: hypothetical protein CSB48_09740 [Proteobacteria bacterium]|nr:MAG: hypothetical protein CSB48_09740 [Pseudomonadota bacterium]